MNVIVPRVVMNGVVTNHMSIKMDNVFDIIIPKMIRHSIYMKPIP